MRTSALESDGKLQILLQSLVNQTHKNWTALIVDIDTKPFPQLPNIINSINGSDQFILLNRPDDLLHPYNWNGNSFGFDVLDWAITKCPLNSGWLLITNGDNWYHQDALSHLDSSFDIIGFDFYSRWTAPFQNRTDSPPWKDNPCPELHKPYCMKNQFKRRKTELASNLINLKKFRKENHTYYPNSPQAEADGVVIEKLVYQYNWSKKHIGICLLSHNPNPWYDCFSKYNWTSVIGIMNSSSLHNNTV